jgi:cardiolipin synthase A/B
MHAILPAEMTVSTGFVVIATLAILAQSLVLFVALFDPGLRYRINPARGESLDSPEFLYQLEALTDAKLNRHTTLEVFTNGESFYPAELEAIRAARRSVNLENYIFQTGEVARQVVEALTERARAGVRVNVVLDALGSLSTSDSYFRELSRAGGRVAWYNSARWNRLPRYNNRTHREILVVDGDTAFVGGAGTADHWLLDKGKKRRWRDTMVRVQGDAVPNLQASFAENWLEACGEILSGPEYFPICEAAADSSVLVINSTPSAGGSTRARMLFQMLIASAQRSIQITTPYFLPDRSLRDELLRAMRERGVEVSIVVPGAHSDHQLTRSSSRAAYGKLLQAGARIYEYQPAMIHAKILIIDGLWSVVGSTNFDNRSFGLNDEVNLAAFERKLSERLQQDFSADVAASRQITYERWRRRSVFERAPELVGWVFERQQ